MTGPWTPRIGMIVSAAQLGKAIVTRLTPSGAMVQLIDLGCLEVELPVDQLTPEEDTANSLNGAVHDGLAPDMHYSSEPELADFPSLPGQVEFRKSVEALRFGLVPDSGLEALTVGIEELSNWSRSRLPSTHLGRPLASAVTGAFGTGKSHTMAVIRRLALRMGYVVARVEVDGRAVSLSAPAKLLHQLWKTTTAGDRRSATPLVDLYLEAISAGRTAPSIAPRGIDRIRQNYDVVATIKRAGHIDKHGVILEGLLSSSEEITAARAKREFLTESNVYFWDCSPRPMIGSRIEDRPYDFVEVLAGHATVAKLAGYKGLVVTVDEFEVEKVLTRLQYSRVTDLLALLTEYFNGSLDYEPAPLALFFATVGDDGHEGDTAISAMVGDSPDGHHYLEPWSEDQRAELAERIYGVYCDAYGLSAAFDNRPVKQVEEQLRRFGDADSGLVRAFIKRYVALLDVAYGPPAA